MSMFAPEVFPAKRIQIEALARKAEKSCPANPTRELADFLDVEAIDGYNVGNARTLARWAGAAKVGRTRREAIEALAGAWTSYRALRRSAAISRRCAARVRAHELKMRAFVAGRSVREQRAHEQRENELVAISMEARRPGFRAYGRGVIAAFAGSVARSFVVLEAAA